ncbi:MAG: Na+/H+ antiporter NhaA [Cryobacterium sp.]|nr:Na+/H+ antiporter NhaA [Cryobacterium sp.]MBX3103576.1 Na+/H+ antiporter NhaA [Cryobacterium sp.]
MRVHVSERVAALLLLGAALLGLVLCNSPISGALLTALHFKPETPFLGFSLDVSGWIKDGLLAVFFLLAAIELRFELSRGELADGKRALVPAVAAVGGVVAPALIFLLIVQDRSLQAGWPIPTATDIAFALGLLAMIGRWLPKRIRALLLALAVIDDLIAIIIIGVFFTKDLNAIPLLIAVPVVLLFGWLSYRTSVLRAIAMILLAIGVWWLVALSGVHPTIAGVALGLALAGPAGERIRESLEPISNILILPIFAFTAAAVIVPNVGIAGLSPVFWAIVVALPVGKIVGILVAGFIGSRLAVASDDRIAIPDLAVVAGLGGVGFTVSLLMNELAFEANHTIAAEGTLAVLAASGISAILGITIGLIRSRHYRKLHSASSS